jgi:hypothetical protein
MSADVGQEQLGNVIGLAPTLAIPRIISPLVQDNILVNRPPKLCPTTKILSKSIQYCSQISFTIWSNKR